MKEKTLVLPRLEVVSSFLPVYVCVGDSISGGLGGKKLFLNLE